MRPKWVRFKSDVQFEVREEDQARFGPIRHYPPPNDALIDLNLVRGVTPLQGFEEEACRVMLSQVQVGIGMTFQSLPVPMDVVVGLLTKKPTKKRRK